MYSADHQHTLEIRNTIITDFCHKYPHFNPEQVLVSFIESFNQAVTNGIQSDLVIKSINNLHDSLNSHIKSLGQSMHLHATDIRDNTVKQISDTIHTTVTNIHPQIKQDDMNQSIRLAMDTISKSEQQVRLETKVEDLHNTVRIAMENIHLNKSDQSQRLETKMDTLHEKLAVVKDTISTVRTDLTPLTRVEEHMTILCKNFGTGASRGRSGEAFAVTTLEQMFPTHVFTQICSSNQKGKMDIEMTAENKPIIRFEIKNYTSTVPTDQVKKFERDILESKGHGIFISLNSKIAGKPHHHIDVLSGRCLAVYLTCIDYKMDSVHVAVNDIYTLHQVIQNNLDKDTQCTTITNDTLEQIREILDANKRTTDEIERSLKDNIEKLRRMSFDQMKSLLHIAGTVNKVPTTTQPQTLPTITCACGRQFKKAGYSAHKKVCALASDTTSE